MTSRVYEYLVERLRESMERLYAKESSGKSNIKLRGLGQYDKRCYPARTLLLRGLVRSIILDSEEKMFLVTETGKICAYNGIYFEIAEESEAFLTELLKRVFLSLEVGSWYNDEYPSRDIARSCLSSLRLDDKYRYVENKRYVAFENGVFDLSDGKLKKGRIEQHPFMVFDFDYCAKDVHYGRCSEQYGMVGNPCRLWDKKIAEIIPNRERREMFQQWCGSLLVDHERYKQEYVLYLIGPGSNGKSVLANVIAGLFGGEYFSRFTLRQLFKDDFRNNRANLRGKIANLIDDLDEKSIGGNDFKSIASGALLETRELYTKKTFKIAAPPILCCTNAIPESYDDSYGQHRRQLPLYTTTKVFIGDERDPELTYKLTCTEARCYIFSWVYEGYKRVMANKGEIAIPPTVKEDCEIMLANSNNMRRWWRHRGFIAYSKFQGAERWMSMKDLMKDYKEYVEMEGTSPRFLADLCSMIESKGACKHRMSAGWGYCVSKSVYGAKSADEEETEIEEDKIEE